MSYLPKVAGFVAMIRVLVSSWTPENLATIVPVLLLLPQSPCLLET